MSKKKLAVFFGGISPEHEVSVITGIQLMKHVDREKYDVMPVYIDKAGHFWTGDVLLSSSYYKDQDLYAPGNVESLVINPNAGSNDIDVALLCFHGQYGEGGNIQGLLELAQIPYQGPALTSSAIAFDKIITRQILSAEKIGQTPYLWFTHSQWADHRAQLKQEIEQLGYPVFAKPANSGSTIGIQKVANAEKIDEVVDAILHYDQRVLIEKEVVDCIEVNVSVLGLEGDTKASVPEQPIKQDEFLSFADKYERGGGKKSGMASATRRIPAPISSALTEKLQLLAQRIFHIFDCSGVVRIDFFVNPSTEEIFVTELNTIPGSMSFYLWEATNLPYPQLIDRLVEIAEQRFAQKQKLITSFETNILRNSTE